MGLILTTLFNFTNNFFGFKNVAGIGFGEKIEAADTAAFRKLDDSGYAVVRGATPVADNDLATKAYADSGPTSGVVRPLGITVGTSTASSTTIVAAGRVISRISVEITTPYSVGATIAISCGGVVLYAAGVINAQLAGETSALVLTPATANGALTVTVAGAPAVGACTVYVEYSTPQQ